MKMSIKRLQEFDREGKLNTPEAREIALRVYERGLPAHNCYWNDRFYIAIRSNLPMEYKKLAAHRSIVKNGDNLERYFEARTHFGFDMISLLRDLGVPEELLKSIAPSERIPGYQSLSFKIRTLIQEKFGRISDREAFDLQTKLCGR